AALLHTPLLRHRVLLRPSSFFFTTPTPPETSTLSLHDALPISEAKADDYDGLVLCGGSSVPEFFWNDKKLIELVTAIGAEFDQRSEEHTSELQSRFDLVCRLLLEKKNYNHYSI